MSVIACNEQWDGRGVTIDEQGVVAATRMFLVETDDNADDEADVEAALPVSLYDEHPAYPRAIARYPFSIKPHGSAQQWLANITYSSAPFKAVGGIPAAVDTAHPKKPTASQNNSTPANLRLPIVSVKRKELLEPRQFDRTGQAVVNAAGDPIEGVLFPRDILVVNIEYFSIKIDVPHIIKYLNKINSDTYLGFPAFTLLCREIDVQNVYETMQDGSGPTFLAMMAKVQVQLEYKIPPASAGADNGGKPWQLHVQNAGLRCLVKNGSGTVMGIEPCRNRDGSEATASVPLHTDGTQLRLPDNTVQGPINYLHFDIYDSIAFSTPPASPPPPPGTAEGLIV